MSADVSPIVVPRILCLGAGGHARVIVDLLQMLGSQVQVVGVIGKPDDCDVLGVPLLGTDAELERLAKSGAASHFIVGVGSVRAGSAVRQTVFKAGIKAGLAPYTAVHPSAVVSRAATLGPGSAIMAASVIQAGTKIGANVIVNTKASIDHDCDIGDHAHIAPGAVCSGGVSVGLGTHIGAGAVVLQGISIGDGVTVGAGATVIKDCAPNTTVVGTPASRRS